jgi:O-acetyl-ADP-ribose deacetylase (regulator of RNase III)
MVIKAEKAEKEIFSKYTVVCGVIASKHNNVELGEMIAKKNHDSKNTYLYKLVLKKNENDAATYENLQTSLVSMLQHMKNHQIKKVVFPLKEESCIIRELSWNAVRTLIKNVFHEEQVHITAYNNSLRPLPETETIAKKVIDTPFLDVFEKKHLTPIQQSKNGSIESDRKLDKHPQIFKHDKLFFESNVKDMKKLLQYVYAFGGKVVENSKDATKIIHDDTDAKKNGISVKWITDSIKHNKRLDTKLYK